MNMIKILGSLALFAGFLGGAYVVVAQAEEVNWTHYAMATGTMFVGLVALRTGNKEGAAEQAKRGEDIEVLCTSLTQVQAVVRGYKAIEQDEDLLELYTRIDAELVGTLGEFVAARESMIPRFGINAYAEIMSAFATGERLINRVWSASVDGYVDEVRLCLGTALAQFETADSLLEKARA